MSISSLTSTQSLWKFQMQVGSSASSAANTQKSGGAEKAAEELLSVLSRPRPASSEGAVEATAPSAPPPTQVPALDMTGSRISLGLPGPSGESDNAFEFSKEDLAALKQKIETSGKAASDGLAKLIDQFEATDTSRNGKISREEFAAFAEQNGFRMPPAARATESSATGGFSGFSKQDLEGIRQTLEKGMQAISQALQGMIDAFAGADANQSGGLDLSELQSLANNQSSQAAPSDGPVIEIRFAPQQGGEKGLSKEDLEQLKKTLEDSGIEVPKELDKLIESFDKIDQNKDGTLGKNELKAFRESGSEAAGGSGSTGGSGSSAVAGAAAGAESGNSSSESVSGQLNRLLSQQMTKAYSYSASVRYESFQSSWQTDMTA